MKAAVLVVGMLLLATHLSCAGACKCDSNMHKEVCGEDGVTYQNTCYLFCKNLNSDGPPIQIRCNASCSACP